MKKYLKFPMLLVAGAMLVTGFTSCSDDEGGDNPGTGTELTEKETFLKDAATDYVNQVIYPTYGNLAEYTGRLYDQLNAAKEKFKADPNSVTQAEIDQICATFLEARSYWEETEAFLYGAATDFGIDPHIDTWPLDLDGLVTELKNSDKIAQLDNGDDGIAYAANKLGQELLGFHGIEFIIFRNGENRDVATLLGDDPDLVSGYGAHITGREELIYATAVAGDLRNKCFQMEVAWNVDAPAEHIAKVEALEWPYQMTNGLSYGENMMLAGQAGSTYISWRRVSDAIILSGCINICDEVGEVKMGTPHGGVEGVAQDPNYIESPYSWNSITDFYDNLCSIENSLMGGRPESRDQSKSIYAYVNKRNPDLAARLLADVNDAKAKIKSMKYPFVHNYTDASVATAMQACMKLSDTLSEVNSYILNN